MKILILGDSHAKRYIRDCANEIQREIEFSTASIAGATALGSVNPNSKTNALNIYREALEHHRDNPHKSFDYCSIMLGEVDCGFLVWYRAKKYNKTVQEQIYLSVNNLEKFLKNDVEKSFPRERIIVIGATLPTIDDNTDKRFLAGARSEVTASLRERTECTFTYNNLLKNMANKNNYLYFDISKETFDEKNYCAFRRFLSNQTDDHHFDARSVAPLFINKFKMLINQRNK